MDTLKTFWRELIVALVGMIGTAALTYCGWLHCEVVSAAKSSAVQEQRVADHAAEQERERSALIRTLERLEKKIDRLDERLDGLRAR